MVLNKDKVRQSIFDVVPRAVREAKAREEQARRKSDEKAAAGPSESAPSASVPSGEMAGTPPSRKEEPRTRPVEVEPVSACPSIPEAGPTSICEETKAVPSKTPEGVGFDERATPAADRVEDQASTASVAEEPVVREEEVIEHDLENPPAAIPDLDVGPAAQPTPFVEAAPSVPLPTARIEPEIANLEPTSPTIDDLPPVDEGPGTLSEVPDVQIAEPALAEEPVDLRSAEPPLTAMPEEETESLTVEVPSTSEALEPVLESRPIVLESGPIDQGADSAAGSPATVEIEKPVVQEAQARPVSTKEPPVVSASASGSHAWTSRRSPGGTSEGSTSGRAAFGSSPLSILSGVVSERTNLPDASFLENDPAHTAYCETPVGFAHVVRRYLTADFFSQFIRLFIVCKMCQHRLESSGLFLSCPGCKHKIDSRDLAVHVLRYVGEELYARERVTREMRWLSEPKTNLHATTKKHLSEDLGRVLSDAYVCIFAQELVKTVVLKSPETLIEFFKKYIDRIEIGRSDVKIHIR